jgi:hypothetical protein
MNVNEEALSGLSKDQIKYSGKFLEDIFLHRQTNIKELDDSQIKTVQTIIRAVDDLKMKQFILGQLDKSVRLTITKQMSAQEQLDLFNFMSMEDLDFLQTLFADLSKDSQFKILESLHTKDRKKYTSLKSLIQDKVSMVGNILVQQDNVLTQFIAKDKDILFAMINDKKLSSEDAAIFAKKIEKKYESKDLEKLGHLAIEYFTKLRVPFSDQASFSTHLKFYFFISGFLTALPGLTQPFNPLIHRIIDGLQNLPSNEWTMKVLNQFPIPIIELVLDQLINYEKISNSQKRNQYNKLLKMIKSNVRTQDVGNIQFVVTQF